MKRSFSLVAMALFVLISVSSAKAEDCKPFRVAVYAQMSLDALLLEMASAQVGCGLVLVPASNTKIMVQLFQDGEVDAMVGPVAGASILNRVQELTNKGAEQTKVRPPMIATPVFPGSLNSLVAWTNPDQLRGPEKLLGITRCGGEQGSVPSTPTEALKAMLQKWGKANNKAVVTYCGEPATDPDVNATTFYLVERGFAKDRVDVLLAYRIMAAMINWPIDMVLTRDNPGLHIIFPSTDFPKYMENGLVVDGDMYDSHDSYHTDVVAVGEAIAVVSRQLRDPARAKENKEAIKAFAEKYGGAWSTVTKRPDADELLTAIVADFPTILRDESCIRFSEVRLFADMMRMTDEQFNTFYAHDNVCVE